MSYTIQPATAAPPLAADWEDPVWQRAETLEVAHFRPESSEHHPRTFARLLYDAAGIHGIFHVQDRYVRCARTGYFAEVWKDSCVEFFIQPRPARGYFNLEFNCGGAFLCSHIVNPERVPGGFKEFTKVPLELGKRLLVRSSLPSVVEPERAEPVAWTLRFFAPFALFEHYVGPLGNVAGQSWRGNFYKCGDETSHPHWGSWMPVDELNFHLPRCFGEIRFG